MGNNAKRYTDSESEKIYAGLVAGKSYKTIAKELGRTYGSVKNHAAHHCPELIKPRNYFKMKDDEREVERNHPPSYPAEEALRRGFQIAGVYDSLYNPMGIKIES